jgi:hypothetical protein
MQNYLVPTCTVFVPHEKDPCFPCSAPVVFCSVALMSEFDLVNGDFLLPNFLSVDWATVKTQKFI